MNTTTQTFPVAASAYPNGDPRSCLTHACTRDENGDLQALCGKVKSASILDDECWGDLDAAPTCPTCARRR